MPVNRGYLKGSIKVFCDGQSLMVTPLTNGGNTAVPAHLRSILPALYRLEIVAISASAYWHREASKRVVNRVPINNLSALVDMGGQNELMAINENLTAAQTLTVMENYWNARKAEGVDFVIASTLPTASSAMYDADAQTQRGLLNPMILSSSVPDAVADLAALPHAADFNDTTYFYDGGHPTSALALEFAQEFRNEMAGLGLPT